MDLVAAPHNPVGLVYCGLTGRNDAFLVYMVICPKRMVWAILWSLSRLKLTSGVSLETHMTPALIALQGTALSFWRSGVRTGCTETRYYESRRSGSHLGRLALPSAIFIRNVPIPGTHRCGTSLYPTLSHDRDTSVVWSDVWSDHQRCQTCSGVRPRCHSNTYCTDNVLCSLLLSIRYASLSLLIASVFLLFAFISAPLPQPLSVNLSITRSRASIFSHGGHQSHIAMIPGYNIFHHDADQPDRQERRSPSC